MCIHHGSVILVAIKGEVHLNMCINTVKIAGLNIMFALISIYINFDIILILWGYK